MNTPRTAPNPDEVRFSINQENTWHKPHPLGSDMYGRARTACGRVADQWNDTTTYVPNTDARPADGRACPRCEPQ